MEYSKATFFRLAFPSGDNQEMLRSMHMLAQEAGPNLAARLAMTLASGMNKNQLLTCGRSCGQDATRAQTIAPNASATVV